VELCRGLPRHTLANGALVYPSQGIVPKAAWHWVSDSSVVYDPLAEPGRTPLYVAFRPHGAPRTVTVSFRPVSWASSVT
jgi:hypothetical protein